MFHYVARARDGALLFTSWSEGLRLWRLLTQSVHSPVAICVMPNHVHVLTTAFPHPTVGNAINAYARSRTARRIQHGCVFERAPPPSAVAPDKRRRMHRYVVLNPCRAGLTRGPLAWPLCTYLDDVGLAAKPVRRRASDVAGLHQYVVLDDRVRDRDLPPFGAPQPSAEAIVRAVSHAMRVPLHDVTAQRGRARTLAVRAARRLNGWSVRRTANELGIARATVGRVSLGADPAVDIVARLATAPATTGLDDIELRRALARSKYRWLAEPDPPDPAW